MQTEIQAGPISESDADLVCLGLCSDEQLPGWLEDAPGSADVSTAPRKLTMVRPTADGLPRRVLVVGLGDAGDLDPERVRVAAALATTQAKRYEARTLAWEVPEGSARNAAALTGASIMAGYSFDRFRSKNDDGDDGDDGEGAGIETIGLHGLEGDEAGLAAEITNVARVAALAANRARDLQGTPANVADPAFLAARAEQIATEGPDGLTVEVMGPEQLEELGAGGLLSVGAGSAKDPLLIVLRWTPRPGEPVLAIVGKAVTFDTGGISLKPSASMHEMKMDMSGGAAALESTAAIAELGIPVNLLTVVPAVENMPGGNATRPGDVITQMNGTTVEVNNTDAEGRLILADAITWAEREGADRIVDLATLTGAVVVALGSTHAAVIANDDELAAAISDAGSIVGELTWRLPMHPEYLELMKGTVADLTNSAPKRKAGTITAGAFLEQFVDEARWAHIDIAGTAWDVGRPYVGRGPSGYGVRLLVELARSLAAADAG